jgi:glutamate dehydrogenase
MDLHPALLQPSWSSYLALKNVLDDNNPDHEAVLARIKTRFREETFTPTNIRETIQAHPELIRQLYINFAMTHYPAADEASQLTPTLSFSVSRLSSPSRTPTSLTQIRKKAANQHAAQILEAFLVFNKHVLKSNFYQPTKVALSFRLDPGFLPEIEYPKQPFGIFLVVGSDFRGFHVRFRDVARGGIRLVRSRGKENYNANVHSLRRELQLWLPHRPSRTRTFLRAAPRHHPPSLGPNPHQCFEKYIDSVIDLLIPGQSPVASRAPLSTSRVARARDPLPRPRRGYR